MKSIKIIANASYLPKYKVNNQELAQRLEITEAFIVQRTGIKQRYIAKEERIETMAIEVAKRVIQKAGWNAESIEMIIVATTSTKNLMPGIAFAVQKALGIHTCNCMDVLAGCAGYINALDIARNAIAVEKVKNALIIGVEKLTNYIDEKDLGTAIVLSDGAGATLIGVSETEKRYESCIQAEGEKGDILTCYTEGNIQMKGNEVYRYAVTKPVQNVEELLQKADVDKKAISYIVPHQSNKKIMKAMAQRLGMEEKMVYNIETVGNTFCASIPIALAEMEDKGMLETEQSIILLGYGGGVNTASILLEI